MSKRNYGLPYKGSKNKIAEDIINFLPKKKILVDLFGGGGAISDCASSSDKFEKVIYNEIDTIIADTFRKALNGEYKYEDRWISKDEFDRLKDVDGYVAICFSFGNDCKTYLYSKAIEPYKCACHYSEGKQPERLQHRERLRRINNISNNGNIEVYSSDYKELELPIHDECVIYCDIPYEKTKRYKQKFDYNRFYDWVEEKTKAGYQIYISSYELPEDKFTEV